MGLESSGISGQVITINIKSLSIGFCQRVNELLENHTGILSSVNLKQNYHIASIKFKPHKLHTLMREKQR